jgi:hypothetical protein
LDSKAYFEIFQVDYVCEIKLLISHDLYKNTLLNYNIDPESVDREIYKGMISDYLYNNIKLFDEKGYKLNLISYELLTKDILNDKVEIKLNYSKQVAEIYWVINTMFFDFIPEHLNYHSFSDDNYKVTSMNTPNFSMVAVKKQYVLWILVIVALLTVVGCLMYKTST